MLSFVDSHSSLSLRRKTKTQIEALRTRTNSPPHCARRKARTLSAAKKPQNRTRKTTTQNKREPPQTRKSNIYQRRRKYRFPHTTTAAPINSISIYKTESVFPKL